MSAFDPTKYALSEWVWILLGLAAVGFVILGSNLVQTHQRLNVVDANLRSEIEAANAARDKYQNELDNADAAMAELSKQLGTAQLELVKRQSQLQGLEAALENAKQATDRAEAEAAEAEKQIAKLKEQIVLERQGIQSQMERLEQAANQAQEKVVERDKQVAKLQQGTASCEEFFDDWELRGAPASLSAIAGLGREAAAAKDCIGKGDVAAACKHWQGLLVEIEKMGPPLSESRGDIEQLIARTSAKPWEIPRQTENVYRCVGNGRFR